jgi:hypothetical protein
MRLLACKRSLGKKSHSQHGFSEAVACCAVNLLLRNHESPKERKHEEIGGELFNENDLRQSIGRCFVSFRAFALSHFRDLIGEMPQFLAILAA